MALNQTQVAFSNQVVRPMIERLIRFASEMDSFMLDFDNQQSPLPTDSTVLDDNAAGDGPRPDAPQITGAQATQLRAFVGSMRGQINATALNTLVSLAVRDVATITRGPSS